VRCNDKQGFCRYFAPSRLKAADSTLAAPVNNLHDFSARPAASSSAARRLQISPNMALWPMKNFAEMFAATR
jgi:hypothetical protein